MLSAGPTKGQQRAGNGRTAAALTPPLVATLLTAHPPRRRIGGRARKLISPTVDPLIIHDPVI